jgi:DNA-binding MarR family transcriptional regulator
MRRPVAFAAEGGLGDKPTGTAGASISPDTDELTGRLYVAIARLTRMLRRDAPVALSLGSISALSTVAAGGPMRVGDLAAAEGVRAPTMTRIVDGLVADGYAERIPDPGDRRACLVRATPAGVDVLAGARSARARLLAAGVARLPQRERAALAAALPAIEALCADDSTVS